MGFGSGPMASLTALIKNALLGAALLERLRRAGAEFPGAPRPQSRSVDDLAGEIALGRSGGHAALSGMAKDARQIGAGGIARPPASTLCACRSIPRLSCRRSRPPLRGQLAGPGAEIGGPGRQGRAEDHRRSQYIPSGEDATIGMREVLDDPAAFESLCRAGPRPWQNCCRRKTRRWSPSN